MIPNPKKGSNVLPEGGTPSPLFFFSTELASYNHYTLRHEKNLFVSYSGVYCAPLYSEVQSILINVFLCLL